MAGTELSDEKEAETELKKRQKRPWDDLHKSDKMGLSQQLPETLGFYDISAVRREQQDSAGKRRVSYLLTTPRVLDMTFFCRVNSWFCCFRDWMYYCIGSKNQASRLEPAVPRRWDDGCQLYWTPTLRVKTPPKVQSHHIKLKIIWTLRPHWLNVVVIKLLQHCRSTGKYASCVTIRHLGTVSLTFYF